MADKPKEQNSADGPPQQTVEGASSDTGLTPGHWAYASSFRAYASPLWGLRPGTSMTCRRRVCVIRRNLLKRAGYQSIWVPENHFGPQAIPDPLMLLASIAGATQSIRLGTTSYLLTLRNPLQAAEQVAVLDRSEWRSFDAGCWSRLCP